MTDSNTLLDAIERETGPAPRHSIVWLHGLGADGNDFAPLVPQLVAREWPAIRFVFPHAPVRPVTINNGVPMRAWYDIRTMGFADASGAARADADGVAQSVAQVTALIDREVSRGVPAARIFLAGFSQGGAVTLATGVRRREPLAGLIALSTYLPDGHSAERELAEGARRQPVFMAHGTQDPVVPFAAGEQSAAALKALGFSVDWHPYAMPHSVCPQEIDDLRAWLSSRLAAG